MKDPLLRFRREWASLAETTNLSFNQVSAVCSTDGLTACTGNVGAIETTGWTWATRNQVRDLFIDFGIAASDLADYSHSELSSTWAPAIVGAFTPTFSVPGVVRRVTGLPSTALGGFVRLGNVVDFVSLQDGAEIGPFTALDTQSREYGVFLFREPAAVTPVPEPATGVLLIGGLITASIARRRSSRASR